MYEDVNSAEQAITRIRVLVADRYRAPAGILFTMAVGLDQGEKRFLSGKALILDEEQQARGRFQYKGLMLLEEWVAPIDSALERLEALFYGRAFTITGEELSVPLAFWRAGWERSSRERLSGWAEWHLSANTNYKGNTPRPPDEPIVGFGMPPFTSGMHALAEWVWGVHQRGSSSPYLNTLAVALPDTRGRIVAADWQREDEVRVEVESNISQELLELQVLFQGHATERHRLVRAPTPVVTLSVPKDTESIWFCLVHESGERLGEAGLSASQRKVDVRTERLPVEEQAEEDLKGGEGDEVEFKPFIEPKHPKEGEVVRTVVAFANTRGGRLYMGLDDHRGVQGSAELKRTHKGAEEVARESLVKYLRKLIGDKVRPVPKFTVTFIEHRGEPVAVITVEHGDQPPYATDTDEVFVRKGSSNVRPDPLTELRDLCASRGGPFLVPGILGGSGNLF